MTGVGLDLLEIDRLAQALARRPRLAERLFTAAERRFAAERGEPARHLAARFCAKEAVAKALALRDGDWHDVEVLGGGDGAPSVRLSGRARRSRGRAGRRGGDLPDALEGHGRRGRDAQVSRPRWLDPLPDAAAMRAADAWAIETKAIPSLELMERAGEGLARVVAEQVPAGRIAVVCGKGNNGGDGIVAARLLRQAGRDVELLLLWEPRWLSEDAQAMLARLPGAAPATYDAARLAQRARPGRRAARHRLDRCAEGPGGGRDRGSQRGAREGDRGRRAERRRRQHRGGRRRRRPRRGDRDVPPRQARALDRAGEGAAPAPCR